MNPRSLLAHIFTERLSWNVLGAEILLAFAAIVIGALAIRAPELFR